MLLNPGRGEFKIGQWHVARVLLNLLVIIPLQERLPVGYKGPHDLRWAVLQQQRLLCHASQSRLWRVQNRAMARSAGPFKPPGYQSPPR